MKTMLAMAMAALLAAPAMAGEEEMVPLKVYIKGMSCPTGCGEAVTKSLSGMEGAKDVKLENFDKGLFSLSVPVKSAVKPSDLKKVVGKFEIAKVEISVSGTVSKEKDGYVLKTSTGTSYALAANAECCDAKKACEDLNAKIAGWVKEGKTSIKVGGELSECCGGTLSIALACAQLAEDKKVN